MSTDERFMRRAVRLAMNGRGRVEPNPMVGCVVVKDGRVIGEGYHQDFGGPHAEPNALANCTESPAGATAYVTLEPCCHTDKKTPPCVPKLIEAKVARVVIGCLDPNPKVSGRGAAQLRAAGIDVATPVLQGECLQVIEPFWRSASGLSPYVTLKWAESADGKVAGPGGARRQISGPEANRLVHTLRASSDAIVVGVNTVLCDDPLLTPRDVPLRRRPMRVVLDRGLRTPPTSQLLRTAHDWPTALVFNYFASGPVRARFAGTGVQLFGHDVSGTGDADDIRIALDVMRDDLRLAEVLVEPGPTLARAFFSARRVNRLWVIRSPMVIGDDSAPGAPPVPDWLVKTGTVRVGADILSEYRQPDHFDVDDDHEFPPVPSADFVLAAETAEDGILYPAV